MSGPAEIEACHERLHRSGWSIGEVGTSSGWLVSGTNGEYVIRAVGGGLAAGVRERAATPPRPGWRTVSGERGGDGRQHPPVERFQREPGRLLRRRRGPTAANQPLRDGTDHGH